MDEGGCEGAAEAPGVVVWRRAAASSAERGGRGGRACAVHPTPLGAGLGRPAYTPPLSWGVMHVGPYRVAVECGGADRARPGGRGGRGKKKAAACGSGVQRGFSLSLSVWRGEEAQGPAPYLHPHPHPYPPHTRHTNVRTHPCHLCRLPPGPGAAGELRGQRERRVHTPAFCARQIETLGPARPAASRPPLAARPHHQRGRPKAPESLTTRKTHTHTHTRIPRHTHTHTKTGP